MDPAEHLEILRGAIRRFLSAVGGNLERPVPACPEWDVAGLTVHLAEVWRWAADTVATGERAERVAPPPDRSQGSLLAWADEQAGHLLRTLDAADPDGACWTFGAPCTNAFWFRRQALETVLHARDAEEAAGGAQPIVPEIAADGVDEFLMVMAPRAVGRHHGEWAGESVHLHRTDGDGEWVVRLGPEGHVVAERAHARADVALRGSAEALWLWCATRAGPDELGLEVLGERALADRWSADVII